jgi:tetraacyldisaccharide 4'-kinase
MKSGLTWKLAFPLLLPLMLLYALGVRLKNLAFDLGWKKPRHLRWPVVSVGNLSVGGTGKTPVVLLLAELFSRRGWQVDVLSRGYGRASQAVQVVDSRGTAAEFGDEPLLLARRGVPVVVGAERFEAGRLAEEKFSGQKNLHLLDDGFQHRRLARLVDIVLVRRGDLRDDMLPAGRLREPLCALERADICVLRAEDVDCTGEVLRLMRQSDPSRLWIIDRTTLLPTEMVAQKKSALAFCGIGNPEEFFSSLRAAGASLAETIAFRDHYDYTAADVQRLCGIASKSGANCFVTTEKDAARFSPELRARLEDHFPLRIARLELSLQNETEAMALLEKLLCRQVRSETSRVR